MKDENRISLKAPIKIGIGLLALLLLLNSVFLYLLVKERKRTHDLVRAVNQTNEKVSRLREALNKTPQGSALLASLTAPEREKKAPAPAPEKSSVETVRAKPVEALPEKAVPSAPLPGKKTAPVEEAKKTPPMEEAKKTASLPEAKKTVSLEEVKAATPPLERAVKLAIPSNSIPAPLLVADQGEYLLICEKDARALHVLRSGSGRFTLVKSYPCILGANNGDKKKAGDFATPKGIYFMVRYTPGNKLPGDYGTGAFVLNYPNLMDRKEGRNGNGIWLHGHNDKKNLTDLLNTKGCIVVTNDVLKELAGIIKPQGTPIAIVDTLQFTEHQKWQAASEEIRGFVSAWRHAWESINTKKYLSFYAPDFVNSEGMNYETFRKHKEKVNSNKKSIHIKVEHIAALMAQDKDARFAVVRFDQKYQSNNFKSDSKKLLYLRKGKQGWQIIGESVF
ncbi:MAG TPA: L,D-transpeptidase family protein [Syntrophorhabdaceae bacterium]|jgi:murein L,D-transpeptidase YafK